MLSIMHPGTGELVYRGCHDCHKHLLSGSHVALLKECKEFITQPKSRHEIDVICNKIDKAVA